MKKYFDFNEQDSSKTFRTNNDPDFIYAWNQQCYVNTNRFMDTKDFKALDNIKDLMQKQKAKYISEHGVKVGTDMYQMYFLSNGQINEDQAARSLYNAVRYSISYGALGKNAAGDFFNDNLGETTADNPHPTIKTVNAVISGVETAIPELPTAFVKELVTNYRNNEIHRRQLQDYANHEGKLLGREAQIEFVKKSIDSQYTLSQRARAIMSSFNDHMNSPSLPTHSLGEAVALTAVKAVAYVALAPVVATAIGIKVFGGESAEMKAHDALEKVGENFQSIKNNMSKLKNNVLGTLGIVRKSSEPEQDNKYKP